jgi:uncharacterized protein with HEPN domain
MAQHDPRVRLLHMRDYARKAITMIQGQQRGDLDHDEKLLFALIHIVEVIGEAAGQVAPEVQERYPEIPWPKVIGMRHRLIHGYDVVDYDILWDTVTVNLPPLIVELEKILGSEP